MQFFSTTEKSSNIEKYKSEVDTKNFIWDTYEQACYFGMSPIDFWELTHKEVYLYITAKQKKLKDEIKVQIQNNRVLAFDINYSFNGKQFKPLYVLLPDLFEKPEVNIDSDRDKRNLFDYIAKSKKVVKYNRGNNDT